MGWSYDGMFILIVDRVLFFVCFTVPNAKIHFVFVLVCMCVCLALMRREEQKQKQFDKSKSRSEMDDHCVRISSPNEYHVVL